MRSTFSRMSIILAACAAAAGISGPATVAADPFYKGKTIDLIIGSSPGGGYDIYARALARHMSRHIPGNPEIVPKNMPGAGSAKAATYLYMQGAKHGTELGAVFPGAIVDPLLGQHAGKAGYNPTEFNYVGTADNGTRMCVTWHNSQTKTFEEAQKRRTILGASQAGGSTRDYGHMHNKLNGTQFDIVSGYKGSLDILIAMERGEVEGMCGYDFSSLKAQRPQWLEQNRINILVQIGTDENEALNRRGVPKLWSFVNNEEDRKVIELVVSQQIFGRPYFLPPGVPAERVKIMRDAFLATVKDETFLAEAQKLRLDIEPLGGDNVQEVVERLYSSPKALVERAKWATTP